MNASILSALVVKDVQLFFKNRFFAFISVLGLVVYIIVFFLLPSSVDETLELGWAGPTLPDQVVSELVTGGVVFRNYADVEALQEAVLEGDEIVGVSLPQDFYTVLASGGKPQAQIYMRSSVPDEYRAAYTLLLEELGYQIAGMPLQVEAEDVMVGTDMAGQQVPPRPADAANDGSVHVDG
jgi:ABC-2 type transport system permease protein